MAEEYVLVGDWGNAEIRLCLQALGGCDVALLLSLGELPPFFADPDGIASESTLL